MYQFPVSNCLNFLNIENYRSFRAFQHPYNGHGSPLEVFDRVPRKFFADFPKSISLHCALNEQSCVYMSGTRRAMSNINVGNPT